jgi:hypothetical protein
MSSDGSVFSKLIENLDNDSISDSISDVSDMDSSPFTRKSKEASLRHTINQSGTPTSGAFGGNKIFISPLRPAVSSLEDRFHNYDIQSTTSPPHWNNNVNNASNQQASSGSSNQSATDSVSFFGDKAKARSLIGDD